MPVVSAIYVFQEKVMYVFILIIHVIISLLLCGVVLLQSSKGGGLSGAFGGSGGLPQQMLGSKAMSSALHKMTVYLAVGFFLTSAVLFILTADRHGGGSVVSGALEEGSLTSDITMPITPAVDVNDAAVEETATETEPE
jgi:preprotein translocase subunit SecG